MADEASYVTLKAQLLKSGSLYEDPDFPATARSLKNSGVASSRIRWKRPKVGRRVQSRRTVRAVTAEVS